VEKDQIGIPLSAELTGWQKVSACARAAAFAIRSRIARSGAQTPNSTNSVSQ
jgi:hypothetical protein